MNANKMCPIISHLKWHHGNVTQTQDTCCLLVLHQLIIISHFHVIAFLRNTWRTWSSSHWTFTVSSFSLQLSDVLGVWLLFSPWLLRLSHADYPGPGRLPRVQKPLVVELAPWGSLCTSTVLHRPGSVSFLLRHARWVLHSVSKEVQIMILSIILI